MSSSQAGYMNNYMDFGNFQRKSDPYCWMCAKKKSTYIVRNVFDHSIAHAVELTRTNHSLAKCVQIILLLITTSKTSFECFPFNIN